MPLVLNDEQEMLRETAQGFLAEHGPVSHLRKLRDSRDETGFSRELWGRFADMGFTGVMVPEAYGGLGLGHVEAGVILAEIGRNLTPSPFLSTAVLTVAALVRGGSEAHKSELLPKIVAGELVGALAIDEGPKHGPAKTALKAERAGNGFRLSGDKAFVVDGHVADVLLVAARTSGEPGDESGISLFLLDPKSAGVSIERTVMVDSHNAARIRFDKVAVDADAVVGELDQGYALLEAVLNVGRAVVSAEMVGAGEEAFRRTLEYLKDRRQFGRAIGEYQALQHRAAHLYTELEITKAIVLKTLQMLDESPDAIGPLASIAKARAGAAATLAVQEAVQMHGGVGMTDEFDIGFFIKRVRVTAELFGDANFHADRLARFNQY